MRPLSEIEKDFSTTEEKIRSLQESAQKGEDELAALIAGNARLVAANSHKERLPAAVGNQQERIVRLRVEVDQAKQAVKLLQEELVALNQEKEAVGALAMIGEYEIARDRYIQVKKEFDVRVEDFLIRAKDLMRAAEIFVQGNNPLTALKIILDFYGESLDLAALGNGEIRPGGQINKGFIESQMEMVFPKSNPINFNFVVLENAIQSVSWDPRLPSVWRGTLNSALPNRN